MRGTNLRSLVFFALFLTLTYCSFSSTKPSATPVETRRSFQALSLAFEPNAGQAGTGAEFVTRQGGLQATFNSGTVEGIRVAQRDDDWSRLKICDRGTCRWAFYDHSRNNSSRWCASSICGAREKSMRAYRRRVVASGQADVASGTATLDPRPGFGRND